MQLMKEAKIEALQEWQTYVAVVLDEVKVKEGIVYNKHDCKIIGLGDVGDVNNALLDCERSLNDETGRTLTKYIMVRGIFIKLNFPYAQYPTTDLSADILYPIVRW